jgi:hypothetical protein
MPASFVLQYCEYKEQKVSLISSPILHVPMLTWQDYVSWLKDVKGFVDA